MATCMVTGGTSGIGLAFARAFAARGDDVVLVARDSARLERVATELRATGVAVETVVADLADRADVARVAALLDDPARRTDVFVNNAGFGVHTPLLAEDPSPHERGIAVMITAVLVLGGAAARGMRRRGHGAIVNVSSTAGFVTMGSYSAIKAWVTSYTEGLANELHGSGVTATALCPGWVRTEFHERADIDTRRIPNAMWLRAEPLVDACLHDVAAGRVVSIPSTRYRILIALARHAPRGAIRAVSRAISSSRG